MCYPLYFLYHLHAIHKRRKETPYTFPEAVVWRWSVEKVFLQISHNSQESTCATILKKVSGTGVLL